MIIKAPNPVPETNDFKVFLAGSIDMGNAPDWQAHVGNTLSEHGIIVLNPRRDDWNSSWVQSIDNPPFYEQVTWELEALEQSDLIIMCFSATGPAPITLLELGLFAKTHHMIVYCEEGYWRKGNVDIVCKKYHVPTVNSLDRLIEEALIQCNLYEQYAS